MGKKLIIRGADFSDSAVVEESYVFGLDSGRFDNAVQEGNTPSVLGAIILNSTFSEPIRGHLIKAIKLKVFQPGKITFVKSTDPSLANATITVLDEVYVENTGIQYLFLNNPFTLDENEFFGFYTFENITQDNVRIYMLNNSGAADVPTGYYRVGGASTPSALPSNFKIPIDLIY